MNEREALLRAVCENPDDDTPRLVFADWLQENGEEPRAEFIRVQIALLTCERGQRRLHLTRRERDLLNRYEERWLGPVRPYIYEWSDNPWWFRRGFVEALELRERTLIERGDELFGTTPLMDARLPRVTDWARLGECPHLWRLRSLDFTDSDFDSASGIGALFGSPYFRNIQTLVLDRGDSARDLDLNGLEELSRAFEFGSLKTLSLNNNRLGPEAIRLLGNAPFAPQVEAVHLDGIELGDEGIDWLAECRRFKSLKRLSLNDNHISDRGARRLIATSWLWDLDLIDLHGNGNPAAGDEPIESETLDWLWERFGERIKVGY